MELYYFFFFLYLLNVWNLSWQNQEGVQFEICDVILSFCDVVIHMYHL